MGQNNLLKLRPALCKRGMRFGELSSQAQQQMQQVMQQQSGQQPELISPWQKYPCIAEFTLPNKGHGALSKAASCSAVLHPQRSVGEPVLMQSLPNPQHCWTPSQWNYFSSALG